jgi:hypothetical protein
MWCVLVVLLSADDPTGLQAALEGADAVKLTYQRTGDSRTLINRGTLRELAGWAKTKGEVKKVPGIPATDEVITLLITKGKTTMAFKVIGGELLIFGEKQEKMIKLNEPLFWKAIRFYFDP